MIEPIEKELQVLLKSINLDLDTLTYSTKFHGITVDMSVTVGLPGEERIQKEVRGALAIEITEAVTKSLCEQKYVIVNLLGVCSGYVQGFVESIIENLHNVKEGQYTNESVILDSETGSLIYTLEREVWFTPQTIASGRAFTGKVVLTPQKLN